MYFLHPLRWQHHGRADAPFILWFGLFFTNVVTLFFSPSLRALAFVCEHAGYMLLWGLKFLLRQTDTLLGFLPVEWQLSSSDCSSPFSSSPCESSERLMLPTRSLFSDITNRRHIIRRFWFFFLKAAVKLWLSYAVKNKHFCLPSSKATPAIFSWSLLEWPRRSKPFSDRKSMSLCLRSEDLSSVRLSLSWSVGRHKTLTVR